MKTREVISTHKIALLATGDEISNGDILNTNAREIARRLSDLGMLIGMHTATADHINDIEKAILFLLTSHQALIITGGLGPTSDDLTRFALGNAVEKPLVFDSPTWETIVSRLKHFGYATPPESNKQQALFPENATIIPNPNGTAAGCYLQHNNQWIFMLPGPPPECLPMIETTVIPILQQNQFQEVHFHKHWMLFSVSEGEIAEKLDAICKPFDCMTGYRIFYPYIEFKIHSNNEKDFHELIKLVEKTISPYLISEGSQTASDMLRKHLESYPSKIQICDRATGGLLESTLKTPKTCEQIIFADENNFSPVLPGFVLSGLNDYWERKRDLTETSVELTYQINQLDKTIKIPVPFRGDRVKNYVVEWACHQMNLLTGLTHREV